MNESDNLIPWNKQQYTRDSWGKFLVHDFSNPARALGYQIVERAIEQYNASTFLEMAFGQCYDYDHCFQQLPITYTGYDIVPQFVRFARAKFSNVDFRVGGFTDIVGAYDISYARHIFEHLDPRLYEMCLRRFLTATKHQAIISWFLRPGGQACYKRQDTIQFNIHSKLETLDIIEDCGFMCEEIDASFGNPTKWQHKIYALRKIR